MRSIGRKLSLFLTFSLRLSRKRSPMLKKTVRATRAFFSHWRTNMSKTRKPGTRQSKNKPQRARQVPTSTWRSKRNAKPRRATSKPSELTPLLLVLRDLISVLGQLALLLLQEPKTKRSTKGSKKGSHFEATRSILGAGSQDKASRGSVQESVLGPLGSVGLPASRAWGLTQWAPGYSGPTWVKLGLPGPLG